MAIRQVSVFLNDAPGTLADLTKIMMDSGINLRALNVADARDFGIVRLITDDPDATLAAFEDAGFVCSVREVLAFAIVDKPGAMYELLKTLGDAGINIDYSYAFTTSRDANAYMVARVDDVEHASKALEGTAVTLLSPTEIAKL